MNYSDMRQIRPIAQELMDSGLPKKPRFGNPCNHCGLCCSVQQCPVSKLAFGEGALPCPALKKEGSKVICQFVKVEAEHELEPTIQKQLGVGCGCSMPDLGTTDEEKLRFDQHSIIFTLQKYGRLQL